MTARHRTTSAKANVGSNTPTTTSFLSYKVSYALFLTLFCASTKTTSFALADDQVERTTTTYGVDVSYPIHHAHVSTNYPWLPHNVDPINNPTPPEYANMPIQPLGDRKSFYENIVQGCRDHWGPKDGRYCDESERDRIQMNLEQPRNMKNFTQVGYKKIRCPETVYRLLREFWDANRNESNWQIEKWIKGYAYVNYWDEPSYMVNIEDGNQFVGAGPALKKAVWDAAQSTLENWSGQRLKSSSLYGIRVYKEGHFLATHVDRLPLVSSAIINVDQDLDEPWPIEVIGHDGVARNITMEPGDMVLYESHSILHGRPFALKGRYYANIFVHFAPLGKSSGDANFKPNFVAASTPEAEKFWKTQLDGERYEEEDQGTGHTLAQLAAMEGKMNLLVQVAERNASDLSSRDNNGWQAIHEACRAGRTDVVKFLLEHGVDANAVTNSGHRPLDIALQNWGLKHDVVELLKSWHGVGGRFNNDDDDDDVPDL